MKTERLKTAVKVLQAALEEIQREVNDFHNERSEWYDKQLQLLRSGLMNDPQFDKFVWREQKEMHTGLDDTLYAIQNLVRNLDKGYENFCQTREHLHRVVSGSPFHKPWDWKEWRITFEEKGCSVPQVEDYYGPSSEYAKQKCLQYHEKYDPIQITRIEEVRK